MTLLRSFLPLWLLFKETLNFDDPGSKSRNFLFSLPMTDRLLNNNSLKILWLLLKDIHLETKHRYEGKPDRRLGLHLESAG
jgi:hypothetical protein